MKHTYSPWYHRIGAVTTWITALVTSATKTAAQPVYSGGGITEGINTAGNITGVTNNNLRQTIGTTVDTALSYTALAAVVVIVIAGLYLILGLGSDSSRDTARKIVLYTGVGIVIILLAKSLVFLFISFAS